MGLLNLFNKDTPGLSRLPSGSFTLNREGEIIISTVHSAFPVETIREIGRCVLDTFHEAQGANLPLAELNVHFSGFKIVAREMRGGAIVFLSPREIATAQK